MPSLLNSLLEGRTIGDRRPAPELLLGVGDVVSVTIFEAADERLLDAIADAEGPRYPAFETYVTLRRGSRAAKAYLNQIIESPDENVYLYPGDTVVLNREFRSFMALGASGQNGQINFDNGTLSLSQALGKAGGILDSRGDPAESYVFRLEYKKTVAQIGFDTTPYLTPMVPVIYRVNLREPDGFFLAGKFMMRDGDALFVSNARSPRSPSCCYCFSWVRIAYPMSTLPGSRSGVGGSNRSRC